MQPLSTVTVAFSKASSMSTCLGRSLPNQNASVAHPYDILPLSPGCSVLSALTLTRWRPGGWAGQVVPTPGGWGWVVLPHPNVSV